VDDLTFAVASGETLGLLGPTGPGKTTTIKMVTGFAPPTGGTLEVLGLPMAPATHPAIKARLGIMQQEESLDPDLSVEKNLTVYATYFGLGRAEALRRAEELMRCTEAAARRAGQRRTLAGGRHR